MRPIFRIAAALAALVPTSLAAQSPGRVPRVLELPSSTRAMALGDAYMMTAGASDALFYHPALVDGATGFGLDIQNWSGEASAATASAAMAWYGGGVAVGLQTLQYGAPSEAVSALPAGQDLLFDRGASPVSERVATLGLAHEIHGIKVGVAGKLIEERIAGQRDATGAVDVGVATRAGPLAVGLTAANLGGTLQYSDGDASLPRRFTLGAGAYGKQVGPLDMGLAGALTRRDDGEVLAGAGLELGYWPVIGRTFVARAGVQRVPEGKGSPFTFGFAYWGDSLVLEWAYRDFGDPGRGTHRFGVRWH